MNEPALEIKSNANLDALCADDLVSLSTQYLAAARDLDHMGEYCLRKSNAMHLRASGDLVRALDHERRCDAIFKKLPAWAKW